MRTGYELREGSRMIAERIERARIEDENAALHARIRMTRACLKVLDRRLAEELRAA